MVILYFIILIIYSSLSLFYFEQRKLINSLGTFLLCIVSSIIVSNLTTGLELVWRRLNIFALDNSLSEMGKFSLLVISLFFLFLYVSEKKQDQIQNYPTSLIGNFILLFTCGAVLFDSLLSFYFFYESVWLLLMYLLGLLFYQEKSSFYRILINIMFGSTLVNIFCILSLSSLITTKLSFFNLNAQTLMELSNIKSTELNIDFLFYILIGVLILKTLFPVFYTAQLESNQKKLQSYIFNIHVAVNTVLAVYVLTVFFKDRLNMIFLDFAWGYVALPLILIFLGSFFIIRLKSNDNFFKSILFGYNIIFISSIMLIAPISSKMVCLFTSHFLILFGITNIINEILKDRFGNQALWMPLNLKKNMPKFFFLLMTWMVVVCGFPWSSGNLVKMFYLSKLASQSLFAIYLWSIFVFMLLLLFIPFILNVKKIGKNKEEMEKVSDVNIFEFGMLFLLIGAELLLGVGGQNF